MNEFSTNKKYARPIQDVHCQAKPLIAGYSYGKSAFKRDVFVEKENCLSDQSMKNKPQYRLSVSKGSSVPQFTDQKNKLVSLEKIDHSSRKKTIFETAYSKDYFEYLRSKEIDSIIAEDNFSRQTQITPDSRIILTDYFMELKATLNICMNTIYLAVQFVDMLLNEARLASDQFYLIGMATLLIASKMEDNKEDCLDIPIILKLSNYTLTESSLIIAEKSIMELNLFKLGFVTRHHYVEKLWKVFKSEKNRKAFELMSALTLYDHRFATLPASSVVYCLLELLEATANQCKKTSLSNFIDNNGEFEAAKDYLNLKIVDIESLSSCTSMILKTASKITKSPMTGLKKTFSSNLELLGLVAAVNHF